MTATLDPRFARPTGSLGHIPSPTRLLVRVLVIVCLAEGIDMLVLPQLVQQVHGTVTLTILDVLLMAVLSAPPLWFFVVRPLRGAAVYQHRWAATVVAYARDGLVTIGSDGLVESFNPEAERMFGCPASDIVGRPIAQLMPERYHDVFREIHDTGTTGTPLQVHGLRRDGREFPMELSSSTWTLTEGTFHTVTLRDMTEHEQVEEAGRARSRQLLAVRAIAGELTRELNLEVLLDLITHRASELLGVSNGGVLLWDEPAQQLRARSSHGFGPWFDSVAVSLGEGFAGLIASHQQGFIVPDYSAFRHARPDGAAHLGKSAVIGQPLLYRDRLLGVIVLSNLGTSRQFGDADLEVLGMFADQAAVAIQTARLHEQLQALATPHQPPPSDRGA
jgi:PAS domain S-box-containing protein